MLGRAASAASSNDTSHRGRWTCAPAGARSGIELPGESPGIVRPVDSWSRIDLATHSFGQGVSVTAVQMAAAFAAIANGGLLMRAFLVRRTVTAAGDVTFENRPTVVRRVVSPRTAKLVQNGTLKTYAATRALAQRSVLSTVSDPFGRPAPKSHHLVASTR